MTDKKVKPGAFAWACVMFAFAALQFNDPEPLLWTTIYAACGLAWVARGLGRESSLVERGLLLVLVFSMGLLFDGVVALFQGDSVAAVFGAMSEDRPYVEEAREFLGLGIAAVGWLWVAWRETRGE